MSSFPARPPDSGQGPTEGRAWLWNTNTRVLLRRLGKSCATIVILGMVVLTPRLLPHAALLENVPSSSAIYDRNHQLLRLTLAADQQYRLKRPLNSISSTLKDAILLHEDQWFYFHPGINPYGLVRGAWVTYLRHGAPQGGSTITMQLARLLWHLNTRSPLGKLRQVFHALELELVYSKAEIFEAYLNTAPYGGNIQGSATASLIYFDKPAHQLTLPEALTLAVLPQNPSRHVVDTHGTARQLPISDRLTTARDHLFEKWIEKHPSAILQKPLFALPLTLRPANRLPFEAPHAVEQALAMQRDEENDEISTEIDLTLQRSLERQLALYVQRQSTRGIHNAAALLVDTRDMGIRALVGSADYADATIQGQVNGTLARRSPGSTLKPFVYALGFDQGVLVPQTILKDVPMAFWSYTPENYDSHFLGPLTAEQALIRSRNIPAVWVASQLHTPDLYSFLRQAGVNFPATDQHYGLSLALGSGEVTMQELAGLYALLANQGLQHPIRLLMSASHDPGKALLSPEAAFMVRDILAHNPPPPEAGGIALPIAWKTGTSWGFHDAWTAGLFGPYALVIWVGNFDSAPNPAFIGAEAAAPLFFHIVDALQAEHIPLFSSPQPVPAGLRKVEICLASGNLPTPWCPRRGMSWFIPGKSPIKFDTVFRPVVIDDHTGLQACPPYTGKAIHTEVFEFWPSDFQTIFRKAGIPLRLPPQHRVCDEEDGLSRGPAPVIEKPNTGSVYTLRLHDTHLATIPLIATADATVQALYWFLDNTYIGSTQPGETFYWHPTTTGHFQLRVVSDDGRGATRPLLLIMEP